MKFKKMKKQQKFWLTLSVYEATDLLLALIEVEPQDLSIVELHLINNMKGPIRKYLHGTLRHQGSLPRRMGELLEWLEDFP